MILSNYGKIFKAYQTNNSSSTRLKNLLNQDSNYVSVAESYAIRTICGAATYEYGLSSNKGNRFYLDVGFGDTPESPADYCLADANYLNRKLTNVGGGAYSLSDREMLSVYGTFRNDGADNVIVKEVGFIADVQSTSTVNPADVCLFCRKVLDTPIVIAPGESYSFNYRIRIKDN